MKKIWTMTLVLTGVMACSAAIAGVGGASANTLVPTLSSVAIKSAPQPGKAFKAKSASAQRKFRYLDMVARQHPPSIRNAVIVYDHALMQGKSCRSEEKPQDKASVSECLSGPLM